MIRFYDSTSGSININEQNIKNFTLESLRNNISIVTQRVYIFNDTVGLNVSYGQEYCEERVKNALFQAHALECRK